MQAGFALVRRGGLCFWLALPPHFRGFACLDHVAPCYPSMACVFIFWPPASPGPRPCDGMGHMTRGAHGAHVANWQRGPCRQVAGAQHWEGRPATCARRSAQLIYESRTTRTFYCATLWTRWWSPSAITWLALALDLAPMLRCVHARVHGNACALPLRPFDRAERSRVIQSRLAQHQP